MSFIDYGLEIFSTSPDYEKEVIHSRGDYILSDEPWNSGNLLKNFCCNAIAKHFISLGSYTEKKLNFVQKELENYKALRLTNEQIDQLRELRSEYKYPEIETLIKNTNLDGSLLPIYIEDCPSKNYGIQKSKALLDNSSKLWISDNDYENIPSYSTTTLEINEDPPHVPLSNKIDVPDLNFRTVIIQKDSEIISLKNENAAKETELKEIYSNNKKLESHVDELKSKLDKLKSNTKVQRAELEDLVRQKNQEQDLLRENSERLAKELRNERQSRKTDVDEIMKLQNLIAKTEASRKNLIHRIEALDISKSSQTGVIRKLQQECRNFEKQSEREEFEMERLLSIIQRLSDKYDQATVELSLTKGELDKCKHQIREYREQMTTTEREVGKLISDLGECLAPSESEATSCFDDQSITQAQELSRAFAKIVREHEKCREQKLELVNEIERLVAINRANAVAGMEAIKRDAFNEVKRLKEIIANSENYENIKTNVGNIFDHLVSLLNTTATNKPERSYLATQSSETLERLDYQLNDHKVQEKYANLQLLELEKMQEILNGVEKSLNGMDGDDNVKENLDACPLRKAQKEEEKSECCEDSHDYDHFVHGVSRKILNQIKNCKKGLEKIVAHLQIEKGGKQNYTSLEGELQKAQASLRKIELEKRHLQNQYDDCQKKCKELAVELDKLETSFNEKSCDLNILNKKLQSNVDFHRQEKEALQKQLITAEVKFQQSVEEVVTMTKTSDEFIRSLQKELQTQNLKVVEFDKVNEVLNVKLKESEKMIDQLQQTLKNETTHKLDVEKFIASHNNVMKLIKDKSELMGKNCALHSQLLGLEKNNNKVQTNLAKMLEDNHYLEVCINYLKKENEHLVSNINKKQESNVNIGLKYNEVLDKVKQLCKNSKQNQKVTNSDSVIRQMEKEIKIQKEKLREQQKELQTKEQEIQEKNKILEGLNNQINQKKSTIGKEANPVQLLKEIEKLNSEKMKLENELRQTLIKQDDKLNALHKHYKQLEIELRKNHDDSMRLLEAKYKETMMNKEEKGKAFDSENWLQSLNKGESQELHDKICKNSICPFNNYKNELNNDQNVKLLNKSTTITLNSARRPPQAKKELRTGKIITSSSSRSNSRVRLLSKESLSYRSCNVSERDYSSRINTAMPKTIKISH